MPELAEELASATGTRADPSALSRWLIRNGYRFKNVWPAPSAIVMLDGGIGLHQCIRSQGRPPGQDGYPRVSGPDKLFGVKHHIFDQASAPPIDRYAICPSGKRRWSARCLGLTTHPATERRRTVGVQRSTTSLTLKLFPDG
jgi:hypothetical protein